MLLMTPSMNYVHLKTKLSALSCFCLFINMFIDSADWESLTIVEHLTFGIKCYLLLLLPLFTIFIFIFIPCGSNSALFFFPLDSYSHFIHSCISSFFLFSHFNLFLTFSLALHFFKNSTSLVSFCHILIDLIF